MTRAELQAAVHRALRPIASQMTTGEYVACVDSILAAADLYKHDTPEACAARVTTLGDAVYTTTGKARP